MYNSEAASNTVFFLSIVFSVLLYGFENFSKDWKIRFDILIQKISYKIYKRQQIRKNVESRLHIGFDILYFLIVYS